MRARAALRLASSLAGALAALAARPHLWTTAARQLAVLCQRSSGGTHLPDASYLGWRAEAAYGDRAAPLAARDVVSWLEWCRRARRLAR
ncbi:MAG: hypothetical protein ACRDYD_11250 [Acidimicrobiales bacterium]